MHNQPQYLVKTRPRGGNVLQIDTLTVHYRDVTVSKPGYGGLFTYSVPTGKVERNRVTIHAPGYAVTFDLTLPAVRQTVRRLRDQEASELAAIDQQIEACHQRIRELRTDRRRALYMAWERGNAVAVQDVRDAAEAVLARRQSAT